MSLPGCTALDKEKVPDHLFRSLMQISIDSQCFHGNIKLMKEVVREDGSVSEEEERESTGK